jgi:hypothetical protein
MAEKQYQDSGETKDAMSAERGWIGEPQPPLEWRDPHYSRLADRVNAAARPDTLPPDSEPPIPP